MALIQRPPKTLPEYENDGHWLLNTKLPSLKEQFQVSNATIQRDVDKIASDYERIPWPEIDVFDLGEYSKNKYTGRAGTGEVNSTWGVAVSNDYKTLVWEGWRSRPESMTWSDFITAFMSVHYKHANAIGMIRHIWMRDILNKSWTAVMEGLGMLLKPENTWRTFMPSTYGFHALVATGLCKCIVYLLGQHKGAFPSRFTIVQIKVNPLSKQMIVELGILTSTGFTQ